MEATWNVNRQMREHLRRELAVNNWLVLKTIHLRKNRNSLGCLGRHRKEWATSPQAMPVPPQLAR